MARSLFAAVVLNVSIAVVHLFAWVILPFDSQQSVTAAWQILLGFQAVFLAAIVTLYYFFPEDANRSNAVNSLVKMDLRWPAIVALIGLLFHLIAKQPILEQVDWQCITRTRLIWISYDKGADPTWRRVLSMLAYVLSHFAMPVIFISAFRLVRQMRSTKNWFYFLLSMAVIVMFALVIVSRMVLLMGVAVAISGGMLALLFAGENIRQTWSRFLMVFLLLAVLILGLSALVAKGRIKCSGNNVATYMSSNLEDAKAMWKGSPTIFGYSAWGTSKTIDCEVCLPVGHYLLHGVWNISQITATNERGAPELFAFANHYLSRLGFQTASIPKKRIFTAGGIGLAGAAFHDYGWTGVVLVAIGVAMLWRLSFYFLTGQQTFWLGLVLFPCLVFTMVIQFMFMGPATISFPFTFLAFLLMSCLPCNAAKTFSLKFQMGQDARNIK